METIGEKVYNISVIGDSSVGKTSWITMLSLGLYPKIYLPTLEKTSNEYKFPITCEQKHMNINIKITEHPGKDKISFSETPDGIIALFDINKPSSYIKVKRMISEIKKEMGQIHIILCANKFGEITIGNCPVSKKYMDYENTCEWIRMSVKNCVNYPIPLLKIIKNITGNENIKLIENNSTSTESDSDSQEYYYYASDSEPEIYEENTEIYEPTEIYEENIYEETPIFYVEI